jgi:AIG2-like family
VKRRLYLAYGSNLNVAAMKQRCPDAVRVGSRMIDNAQLVFRGVADMLYMPGHKCPAALWEISERDEEALDRFEGVGHGLYRKYSIPVHGRNNKRGDALLYLMDDDGIYPPSEWYAAVLRKGYRDFKLDQSYLDAAIAHSFSDKAPSAQTESRRARQKQSTHQPKLVTMPESVAIARMTGGA